MHDWTREPKLDPPGSPAEEWVDWTQDVIDANLHDTEPTLLQVFYLTEHGSFREERDAEVE